MKILGIKTQRDEVTREAITKASIKVILANDQRFGNYMKFLR